MVVIAAAPAHSSEVYVAASTKFGESTYMVLNSEDWTFSDQQKLMYPADYNLSNATYGNGIGDFNNDGQLDFIIGLGIWGGNIYVFPKAGPGNQFDPPIWAGEWSEGAYPADIAVADFNGDGNMDFVMNYYYTTHCGLYLGDGKFGFTYTLLKDASPPNRAIGIDAADFNNDEMVDFIVAPNDSGPFYVHLGNNDGTFTRVVSERAARSNIAYGIAAGNFIEDGDGFTDLAVSAGGNLEVYRGNGDGTFVLEYSWDLDINTSSLDNGDFNGDGHQDVVVGDYGTDHDGVAVLLGNGQGEFYWDNTYLGDSKGYRKSVTALPFLLNKKPVAHVTPETIKVTVGEPVEWDASGSYDEDGRIVSYEWDHGEGIVAPMTMDAAADTSSQPQSSHTYYDSGTYYVTLKVTDDKGESATVQAEVLVEPITMGVRFLPSKLNLKSKGKWITATIWVPGKYNAGKIDPASLWLNLPEGKGSIQAHVSRRDHRYYKYFTEYHKYFKKKYHKKRKLMVKFDRQSLITLLDGATGPIALTVSGEIDKLEIEGTGTIHAFEKGKKSAFQKKLWKQIMHWFAKGKAKHGR